MIKLQIAGIIIVVLNQAVWSVWVIRKWRKALEAQRVKLRPESHDLIRAYIASPEGESVLLGIVARNKSAVRRIVNAA
jgi:hypothetical protein